MALTKIKPSGLETTGNYLLSQLTTSGNLIGNGNVNFNNSGNVSLGAIGNIHISGGTSGYVLQTDGSGTLSWAAQSGGNPGGSNTYIQFNDAGGFGGTAGLTFDKTSNTITANGNITTTNANLGNAVTANYFIGNGSLLTGLPASYSNTNVAAYLPTYTGNFTAGNISVSGTITGTVSSATTAGTVTTAAQPNITSVGSLSSLTVTGLLTATASGVKTSNIIDSAGTNTISVSSANVGIIGNLLVGTGGTGNVTATYFIGNGATLTNIAGGNVTGTVSNSTTAGTVIANAQPNITSVGTLNGLTAGGTVNFISSSNVSLGPVGNVKITGGSSGQYLQTDGSGTLSWATVSSGSTSNIANGTSNVNIPASGGNVNTSVGGNANVLVVTSTGANVTGYLTVTGALSAGGGSGGSISGANVISANYFTGTLTTAAQPNITSVGTLSGLTVTGNITSGNIIPSANITYNLGSPTARFKDLYLSGNTIDLSGTLIQVAANGQINIGNAVFTSTGTIGGSSVTGQVANALISGTVYTNAQPNITSVGTLTSLTVTGNVTAGNGSLGNLVTANFFSGSGNLLSNIQAANVTGTVSNATTAGTVITAAQPNITSVGTLASLTVTANITGGNANLGNLVTANYVTGTLTTAAQPNITAVGTLTNLSVTGNLTTGNLITGGSAGNISGANYISANYFTGTLTTAAQPNVTSLGTLNGLTATGTINFTSASNVSLGAVGNVKITGGSSGQYLQTNGSGDLTWVTVSATGSSISNGTSNVNAGVLNGNVTVGVAGTSNTVVFTSTGVNVAGYLNATGNITGGNLTSSGLLSVVGNANVGNINATNAVLTGNATITGNLTVNGATEYTNVTNLYVKDPIIEMGGAANGGALSSNDGKDRGTLLHYYTTAPVDAFMGWDTSNGEFAFGSNVTLTNEVATFNTFGNVRAGNFIGTLSGAATTAGTVTTAAQPNITSTGTLTSLTVTGNVSSGNANLGNLVTANFFSGSGNLLSNIQAANITGTVSNATTAGTVITAAQPNITSVGTLTSLAVTANANVGNLNATDFVKANGVQVTGSSGDEGGEILLAKPQTNSTIAGTGVTIDVYQNKLRIFEQGGSARGGYFDITALAAGVGTDFLSGGSGGYANSNVAAYLPTYTGNLTAGNITGPNLISGNYFTGTLTTAAQPNITSVGTLASLTVTGNITGGNANLGNLVTANFFSGSGNLLSNIQAANITGTVSSATTAGTVTTAAQPNITSLGSLASLTVTGLLTATANGVKTSNIIDSAGTNTISISSSNVGIIGNLLVGTGGTGWVSASNFSGSGNTLTNLNASNIASGTIPSSVLGNSALFVGTTSIALNRSSGSQSLTGVSIDGSAASATTADTVTTAAQPNITSTGTLVSLTVTGNITSGNATLGNLVTANFFSGSGNLLSNIQAGNITGTVSSATTAGTVTTAAQPNITSVGTLANLAVAGSITTSGAGSGNITGVNFITANGILTDNLLYANGSAWTFSNYSNTNVAAYLPTYTGNLTAGNANLGNLVTANFFSGSGNLLSNLQAGNITGTVSSATTAGTVTTAAQPNITSLGTLTGLTSGGVINFTSASNVSLGAVGNVKITGGTSGQVLSTDGAGTLSWATAGGGGGATVSDNTTTNANTFYPTLANNQTSGSMTSAVVSSTKLYFNPSTGTLNSTIFNSLSDKTVKTNLQKITNALEKLKLLGGYTYLMIDSNEPSAGLLAQEAQLALPEATKFNPDTGLLSLNYNAILGLVVEGINELEARVLRLENNA